jgi:hypothetical protein
VLNNSAATNTSIGESIFAGRSTASTPSSYVVFLIGMRVNRLFAFRKWMQVSAAMPRMLRELYANPEVRLSGRGDVWANSYYWRERQRVDRVEGA